jgi:hypothetical protein
VFLARNRRARVASKLTFSDARDPVITRPFGWSLDLGHPMNEPAPFVNGYVALLRRLVVRNAARVSLSVVFGDYVDAS